MERNKKLKKTVDSTDSLCYSEECYIMARNAYLSRKGVISTLGQAGSCYNKYKEKTGVKRQWKKTEFVL